MTALQETANELGIFRRQARSVNRTVKVNLAGITHEESSARWADGLVAGGEGEHTVRAEPPDGNIESHPSVPFGTV